MSSLSSSLSLAKNLTRASLSNNNGSPPPPPPQPPHLQPNSTKVPTRSRNKTPTTPPRNKQKTYLQRKSRQPSVIELERAIGGGRFRDADPKDMEEQKDTKFDMSTMNFPRLEGPVEKALRETGEWVINRTERGFRMSGKKILKFIFLWLLPIWSFLTASGLRNHQAQIPIY